MITRELLAVIGFSMSTLHAGAAIAQKYPAKSVRIVVGFQPGGATDIAARAIALKLNDALGGSFIVDNRSGAAGNIAAEIVAKATPDGYTMLMANSTIAIPSLFVKLAFDVRKDFAPLSLIAIGPSVLVVHPSLAVHDVKGLIALAKAKPKQLSYGSGGLGNVTHLAMELFAAMAGVDMVHVPYKGGAPSVIGLVSGEVHLLFSSIPAALPQINAGRMKAIGVSISQRSSALPDVPTIHEAGLSGYYAASWYGLLLPTGVPQSTIATLSREIVAIMRAPDIKERMLSQGFEPVGNDPEGFAKFIREELPRWEKVVKAAGITAQ
ncbi:MAG: tripartite tricarboxylate transporter substrate binding protein [Betaproteobacteria bacterium]|nr:tripartite tricarboxylate transporter substrate binding protein [Betaproteobacteria bacterium]